MGKWLVPNYDKTRQNINFVPHSVDISMWDTDGRFNITSIFPWTGIVFTKTRWFWDCCIFVMGFTMLVRRHRYIKTDHWFFEIHLLLHVNVATFPSVEYYLNIECVATFLDMKVGASDDETYFNEQYGYIDIVKWYGIYCIHCIVRVCFILPQMYVLCIFVKLAW